jgi:hypothetical protein
MRAPKPTLIDFALIDALRVAEQVAFADRACRVVLYRSADTIPTYLARPESDAAPEGFARVTTVSRKPPVRSPERMALIDAVRQVMSNLPDGVALIDRVVIECQTGQAPHRPAAYQFITTEGLNVATWFIDTPVEGAEMHLGYEGRGRPWKDGTLDGETTYNIRNMLASAFIVDVEPGECSERYHAGWRMAESFLRHGFNPDCEGPDGHEERLNGFIDRMAFERRLRVGTETSTALAG